ncbi:unnamed protein product [Parajaminaea phylloscopi]
MVRVSIAVCATALALVCLVIPVQAISATGQRVLVVLGAKDQPARYSTLLADLDARGFQVSQRAVDQAHPALASYDERQFDHIVFLADDVQKPPKDLAPQALVDFNKAGGNIVFAYSSDRQDWLRDLARQYSLELAPRSQRLVDHYAYADGKRLDDGSHTTVAVSGKEALVPNDVVFSPASLQSLQEDQPLLFGNASPHLVGASPLVLPLVSPSATSYTASDGGALAWLGTEDGMSLVSAFQLKDSSARVAFIGSKDFLADDFINARGFKAASNDVKQTLNRAVLRDITAWTFQEKGVLRVERRSHYRVRASPDDVRESYEEPAQGGEAAMYRIKDTVRYSLDIAQHTEDLGWVPAPRDLDLQVSFIMIDPFITAKLAPQGSHEDESTDIASSALDRALAPQQSNSTTRYTTAFQLPDRLGVYTFRTHWRRPGWTFLDTKDVAPVRAFNHDEGPRFLPASWPYAAASFSTVAGFLLFTVFWLLTADREQQERIEQKKSQ